MCQISRSKKFIKTEEDIIVYKTLIKNEKGKYLSAYRDKKYILGKEYKVSIFRIRLDMFMNSRDNRIYEKNVFNIYYGLHSYVSMPEYILSGHKVCKFIIPKGSYVNYGNFCDFSCEATIVSNALIFDSILK